MKNYVKSRPILLISHMDGNKIVLPKVCGNSIWKNNGQCPRQRDKCPKAVPCEPLVFTLLTLHLWLPLLMVSMGRASLGPLDVRIWHHRGS